MKKGQLSSSRNGEGSAGRSFLFIFYPRAALNSTTKMILTAISKIAFISISFAGVTNADGLYAKGSTVLQVDGRNYDSLIAKSGKTSVSHAENSVKTHVLILRTRS